MNQNQRKYANERVIQIFERKLSELRMKHTDEGKTLTEEERAKLIRSGKVKLRSDYKKIDRYSKVVDAFDFSKYETGRRIHTDKIEVEKKKIVALRDKTLDEIMLGASEEAKKLIVEFEKS